MTAYLCLDNENYKILNSIWFWGQSHRATSQILIFTDKNKYIGNYHLNMTTDLPNKLKYGKLVFTNTNKEDCDKSLETIVDLKQGIPDQIFIKCEGENGDLYNFQRK